MTNSHTGHTLAIPRLEITTSTSESSSLSRTSILSSSGIDYSIDKLINAFGDLEHNLQAYEIYVGLSVRVGIDPQLMHQRLWRLEMLSSSRRLRDPFQATISCAPALPKCYSLTPRCSPMLPRVLPLRVALLPFPNENGNLQS